jgi:glycosyltransferase involved in cell wall biosynthesis
MNCSLIICTYNWPEALSLVLESVSLQSEIPNEIIIADDGSDESTLRVVNIYSKLFSIPLIHSWQEDRGCRIPHSRNRAIAKSSFEYIIVIDGDTILHEDFIKDHKSFANKGIYIQGSRVLLQPKFTSNLLEKNLFMKPSFFLNHAKNRLNMLHSPLISTLYGFFKSKNINRIRGCNFSLFKEDLLKVNGFNEEINSWGREDSEFAQRLFNSGVLKKHLKFSGIQYHLFHNERVANSKESADSNNIFLEHAVKKSLIWCDSGIDKYL